MSSAVTWLKLGQEIAESHAQHAAHSVKVIPVVVEDIIKARPLLSALTQMHDGCFLDASDPGANDSQWPSVYEAVPGTTKLVRRAAITTALSTGKQVEIIDAGNDLVDVTFRDARDSVPLSAGERMLHAIGRAAAHKCLEEYSFAVVAYESGPLDKPFRKAAWDLMVRQIDGSRRSSPQTLVVVVESEIDVDLHCESKYGFRFAIQKGPLLRRHGADHLRSSTRRIVQKSEDSPVVFFLGAGFSVSSRLPLGDELRNRAILRIMNDPNYNMADSDMVDSKTLGMRFHEWLSNMPRDPQWLSENERTMRADRFAKNLTLERVLAAEKKECDGLPTLEEFKVLHDKVVNAPGSSVRDFAEILQCTDSKIIVVQLNIDCLVECNTSKELKIFASEDEFEGASEYVQRYCDGQKKGIPLLKLHGTIDRPDTWIVTQDQTDSGVCDAQLQTLDTLLEIPEEREERLPWVYVGASMRDRDLLPVLSGPQFARKLDERWVNPYVVKSLREIWRTKRIPLARYGGHGTGGPRHHGNQ